MSRGCAGCRRLADSRMAPLEGHCCARLPLPFERASYTLGLGASFYSPAHKSLKAPRKICNGDRLRSRVKLLRKGIVPLLQTVDYRCGLFQRDQGFQLTLQLYASLRDLLHPAGRGRRPQMPSQFCVVVTQIAYEVRAARRTGPLIRAPGPRDDTSEQT